MKTLIGLALIAQLLDSDPENKCDKKEGTYSELHGAAFGLTTVIAVATQFGRPEGPTACIVEQQDPNLTGFSIYWQSEEVTDGATPMVAHVTDEQTTAALVRAMLRGEGRQPKAE